MAAPWAGLSVSYLSARSGNEMFQIGSQAQKVPLPSHKAERRRELCAVAISALRGEAVVRVRNFDRDVATRRQQHAKIGRCVAEQRVKNRSDFRVLAEMYIINHQHKIAAPRRYAHADMPLVRRITITSTGRLGLAATIAANVATI